jgi:hypothetical protein
MLVVYFAGFATAIYCLAPASENQAGQTGEKTFVDSAFKSDEFAQKFNAGIHKCLDFARETSTDLGKVVRQKLDKKPADS